MKRIEEFAAAALTGIISNRKSVGTDVKNQVKIAWDYARMMEEEAKKHDLDDVDPTKEQWWAAKRVACMKPLPSRKPTEPVNDTNGH